MVIAKGTQGATSLRGHRKHATKPVAAQAALCALLRLFIPCARPRFSKRSYHPLPRSRTQARRFQGIALISEAAAPQLRLGRQYDHQVRHYLASARQ